MPRSHKFILFSLSTFLSFAIQSISASEIQQPNILFITIDDCNDWVGPLAGHPQTKTPSLDQLAQQGITFTNAHCPAPLCGPSRTAMLSGLDVNRTGIYLHINDQDIPRTPIVKKATLLPNAFAKAGYVTYAAGKIFHNGTGPQQPPAFQNTFGKSDFGPRPKKRFVWEGYSADKSIRTSTDWGVWPIGDKGERKMPDVRNTNWAIGELKKWQKNSEKPFFMAVGLLRPHVPWYVPQKWFDRIGKTSEIELPPYQANDFDDISSFADTLTSLEQMPSTEWMIEKKQWRRAVHAYLASIAFADHQVGRLLQTLKEMQQIDNTIIVVTSDHGYHIGEKNRFSKHTLWERATKVPLFISGPNIPSGARTDAAVNLLDLYPTLLELANIPLPHDVDGRSLQPLLANTAAEWPHAVLTTWGPKNYALRDRHFRYIRYADKSEELYDHRTDPNEWVNLAQDPEYGHQLREFRKQLPRKSASINPMTYGSVNQWFLDRIPQKSPRTHRKGK